MRQGDSQLWTGAGSVAAASRTACGDTQTRQRHEIVVESGRKKIAHFRLSPTSTHSLLGRNSHFSVKYSRLRCDVPPVRARETAYTAVRYTARRPASAYSSQAAPSVGVPSKERICKQLLKKTSICRFVATDHIVAASSTAPSHIYI